MKTGRIKLFHCSQETDNHPVLSGEIEYIDGTKDKVSLWPNEHPKVLNGVYYTGLIATQENFPAKNIKEDKPEEEETPSVDKE